jgi:ATP-dependent exoDNAse (exonuclease V) beta subunit
MREERGRALARPSWHVESVTATAHRAARFGHPVQAGRTREPDTGMAWGTLVHTLLEHAMRGPARDRAHLERLANWLTMDNPQLRRVVPDALDTVAGVMASAFWQRALAAEEREVEVPLVVRVEGESIPRLLYGVIDLAFKTADGWSLIDYKTDQADTATLTLRYGEQARHYARQWAGFVAGAVADARLYSIRRQELTANLAARIED